MNFQNKVAILKNDFRCYHHHGIHDLSFLYFRCYSYIGRSTVIPQPIYLSYNCFSSVSIPLVESGHFTTINGSFMVDYQ